MHDIFGKHPSEIAYLTGAGISIPPPSLIPGAPAFISALTEAITDDPNLRAAIISRTFTTSANKRFVGDFLRFEAVMGCIQQAIDPEVQLLRVYSDCAIPNSYHFFLAEQLERGATVLTTNFDNLIEIACRTRGINYTLVVSEEELVAFGAARASFRNPLIKLHGGYNLVDSVGTQRHGPVNIKTTLEQVGRVYMSSESDPLTAVLTTVIKSRHLVVMGYSGCDDFDIMPCIMKEYPLKGLTWIDHNDQQTEVLRKLSSESPDLPPYRLLAAFSDGPSDVKVVRGNTAAILGIDMSHLPTKERFDWTRVFTAWSEEHLAFEAHRRLLLGQILGQIDRFEESVVLLERISGKTLTAGQLMVLYFTLSNLYVYLNDHKRAILKLSEMADFEQEIDGFSLKGFAYYNLARINTNMGQYTEAEMYLDAAIQIFERLRDVVRIGDCLHELGRICIAKGDNDIATKYLELSNRFSNVVGHMTGTGIGFTEIARSLYSQGKLNEAEVYARKAISVFTLNGNQSGLGGAHHALGYILAMRKDYIGASREFKQAIEYERGAGTKLDLGHSLHSLGDMYISMKMFDEAKDCLEKSLKIKREINDKQGIANSELLLQVLQGIELLKAQGQV